MIRPEIFCKCPKLKKIQYQPRIINRPSIPLRLIMSETSIPVGISSNRPQSESLAPEDSVSQVVPTYFNATYPESEFPTTQFRHSLAETVDSDILSSVPDSFQIPVPASASNSTGWVSGSASDQPRPENSISGDFSDIHLGVPAVFLAKRKARKGYCWLPCNGVEFLERGRWRWRCARCKFSLQLQ